MSQITEGKILQTLALNKKSADYEEGYAQGLKDAIKHTDVTEVRDNGYDYPTTKFVCSKCNTGCYEEDNFCAHCGSKFTGDVRYIAETKCRLCTYSETGLEKDCRYRHGEYRCKYDAEPHWIEAEGCDDIEYECSRCHKHNYDKSKYCPNCGAKLK